jgi:hypothetical protein
MRRFPTTVLILTVAVVALVGGWFLFAKSEHDRFVSVQRVKQSNSEIRLQFTVDHPSGRVAREVWAMQNLNGHSLASYAVSDRKGTVARFDEPIDDYTVTFLFDKLVADGIWDLQTRPFRGKDDAIHTVRIEQIADTQHGSHLFRFSDPQYIAVSAGREYEIHLDPKKPVPDLITLNSTSSADDRYLKIVADFESFGSPAFKRSVVLAREKLLKS